MVAALQQAALLQYWTVRCTAAAALAKVGSMAVWGPHMGRLPAGAEQAVCQRLWLPT